MGFLVLLLTMFWQHLKNTLPIFNKLGYVLYKLFLSPTATALTDAMSESVPLFFCSDFREDIYCWFELKKICGGGEIWTLNLPI